jgi:hypothetical protein
MRKIISFIWLVLRILIYMIILLILLDNPILYPICVILFAYIEFKDKLSISVFHGILDDVRKELKQ